MNDSATTATPTKPPRTSSIQQSEQHLSAAHTENDAPPPKPPRPISPQAQAESTLVEAFPDTDPKVVKVVLVASGGQVEPAFNALLSTHPTQQHSREVSLGEAYGEPGMSDPTFKEEAPPARPPRLTPQQLQEEEDERLARQMYAHERAAMERASERQRRLEQPYSGAGEEQEASFEGRCAPDLISSANLPLTTLPAAPHPTARLRPIRAY